MHGFIQGLSKTVISMKIQWLKEQWAEGKTDV
jgi:hypothetical protein